MLPLVTGLEQASAGSREVGSWEVVLEGTGFLSETGNVLKLVMVVRVSERAENHRLALIG